MKKPRAARAKKPRHGGEIRAWRFAVRLDQDTSPLHRALDVAWRLRNDCAADRIESGQAVRAAKQEARTPPARLTKRDQEMALAERRKREPDGAGTLHSLVVKNIADRIDEGWKRFWEALAEGRSNVAPPKPVKRERYRSLTYPQYGNGVRIRDGRVELSMIGKFRLHDHRKIRGRILTVTMKWAQGRWWCIVTTQVQTCDVHRQAPADAPDIGADPGLSAVLTFSDGRALSPPRALDQSLAQLRHEQRALSRKFEARKLRQAAENREACAEGRAPAHIPISNRLRKQIAVVGKIHTKVVNIRDHWHKLGARRSEQRYGRIAMEDHGVQFMIRNRRLARSASDRALSMQKHAFASAFGPRLIMVPNRRQGIGGNSQTCLCGEAVPKALSNRWHSCPACGLEGARDVIAANIVETIGFGTNKISPAPGRGWAEPEREPEDAEGAIADVRESAPAADHRSDRAPVEASTSSLLRSCEATACGYGRGREAKPVVIRPMLLAREPKSPDKTLRKHPGLPG